MAGPVTTASLTWTRGLQFDARSGQSSLVIDSQGAAGIVLGEWLRRSGDPGA